MANTDNNIINDDNNNKQNQKCPLCENEFPLLTNGIGVGDIIECPVCGATLELLSVEPISLEPIIKGK